VTPRGRLASIASALLFAYLLVWMVELTSLRVSESAFDQLQEWSASLPGRMLACGVWLAAVFHGLEGVRAALHRGPDARVIAPAVIDGDGTVSESAVRDGAFTSAIIAFLTWTLVLPGWVLLLRPWLEDVVP
jgi:succinate dehydrogenase/fumarate reductase cytochrome b subunit